MNIKAAQKLVLKYFDAVTNINIRKLALEVYGFITARTSC